MKHTGETFYNQDIQIDSAEFEGCQFDKCNLIYRGGVMRLKNNVFGDVKWIFDGAAANTVQFMTLTYQSGEGGKVLVEEIIASIIGATRQMKFWDKQKKQMPAVCETCYTVFSSGASFGNAINVYCADNVASPCPRCGGYGRGMDGGIDGSGNLFLTSSNFVSEALAVLTDQEISSADIDKLLIIIENVRRQRKTPDEMAAAIKNASEALAPFAHILAPKLAGDLYQLVAVILYIRISNNATGTKLGNRNINDILIDVLDQAAM